MQIVLLTISVMSSRWPGEPELLTPLSAGTGPGEGRGLCAVMDCGVRLVCGCARHTA